MAIDRRRRALDSRPGPDPAVPPDDRVQDARIVLDLRVGEHDRLLDAHTRADDRARADRHVRAQLGGRIDVRGGVDEDGREDVCRRLGELLRARLPGLLEVECVCGNGGAGGLDLAPEVLGLVDEELLAVGEVGEDVLLEAQDLGLLILVVVEEAGLEVLGGGVGVQARPVGAPLDGAADGGEDGLGGEEVDAAVDEVRDVRLGLLDVVEYTLRVCVRHDAAEVCGGVLAHAGAEDHGFGVALLEELEHVV